MNTSVETGYGYSSQRVVNLGLMDDRRNYLIISGLACVLGVILVVTARSTTKPAAPPDAEWDQLLKDVELEEATQTEQRRQGVGPSEGALVKMQLGDLERMPGSTRPRSRDKE